MLGILVKCALASCWKIQLCDHRHATEFRPMRSLGCMGLTYPHEPPPPCRPGKAGRGRCPSRSLLSRLVEINKSKGLGQSPGAQSENPALLTCPGGNKATYCVRPSEIRSRFAGRAGFKDRNRVAGSREAPDAACGHCHDSVSLCSLGLLTQSQRRLSAGAPPCSSLFPQTH